MPRFSAAIKKAFRSFAKGLVILGSFFTGYGFLGATLVGAYNMAQSAYNLYKRNAKKFSTYLLGAAFSLANYISPVLSFIPQTYGWGLEASAGVRAITDKKLFYDNPRLTDDYRVVLGYNLERTNGSYKLPRTF